MYQAECNLSVRMVATLLIAGRVQPEIVPDRGLGLLVGDVVIGTPAAALTRQTTIPLALMEIVEADAEVIVADEGKILLQAQILRK